MNDDHKFVHDMKNMLGIVIGYANLLLDDTPTGDAKRSDIDQIRKAAESALGLLNNWVASAERDHPA